MNHYMNITGVGDGLVGFLSQIGCTENEDDLSNKRIVFERIFVNIDTNGGNTPLIDHFHGKMPHRECVMDAVIAFLSET